jgi:hypothetical protein
MGCAALQNCVAWRVGAGEQQRSIRECEDVVMASVATPRGFLLSSRLSRLRATWRQRVCVRERVCVCVTTPLTLSPSSARSTSLHSTKKAGVVGKYGTRYGASLRKVVKKMEISQHAT